MTLSWVLSALLAFLGPQVFGLTKVIYSFYPPESMCIVVTKENVYQMEETLHDPNSNTARLSSVDHRSIRDSNFSIMESILSMYLPLLILTSSSVTLMVLLHLRKMNRRSDIVRRSCQTVLLMIGGYMVCSIPYAVTPLYPTITPEYYLVFRYLLQTHCIFTPLIYIYRDSNFRKAVSKRNIRTPYSDNSKFSYVISLLKLPQNKAVNVKRDRTPDKTPAVKL